MVDPAQISEMPEVTREALCRLDGAPLALRDGGRKELEEMLDLADGDELITEVYGLMCLAKWLHDAGEKPAAIEIMDVANTATPKLKEHNGQLAETLESAKRDLSRRLGREEKKVAPTFGAKPKEGAVSLQSLTANRPRKLS